MRIRWFLSGVVTIVAAMVLTPEAGAAGQIIISNTQVQSVTANGAVITWTTSVPTASEVDFGTTTQYGASVSNQQLVVHHKLTLHSPLILPGTIYHFITKNDDHNGTVAISNDSYFTTRGTQLNVQVVDAANKPVENAVVSWNDREDTTDAGGWATLDDLPQGSTIIAIQYNNVTTAEFLQIRPPSDHPQNIRLTILEPAAGFNPTLTALLLVAGFTLGLLVPSPLKRAGQLRLVTGRLHAPWPQRKARSRATETKHDTEPSVRLEDPRKPKLSMSVSELHDRFFGGDGR